MAASFNPPPLDGSLTVPELLFHHAKHNPNHPLFVFRDGTSQKSITYEDAGNMVLRAAQLTCGHYARLVDRYTAQEGTRPPGRGPTIGILASTDSISYFTAIYGILSLGFVAFPISPRNSPAAVAHLMRSSHIIQLFVSNDSAMQTIASEALEILKKESTYVELLPMILYADVASGRSDGMDTSPYARPLKLENEMCLLHSSGSSSFPKVIPLRNRTTLQRAKAPLSGEIDVCGEVVGTHGVPIFHGMGMLTIFCALATGLTLSVLPPSSPPIFPTPDRCLEEAVATNCSISWSVPSFLEAWSRDPAKIPHLKTFRAIVSGPVYGGAPLNKAVRDQLIAENVRLVPTYGSTEAGGVSMFLPKEPAREEVDYFKLSPQVEFELLAQDGQRDLFEAVVIDTPNWTPGVINFSTADGRRGYRTGDLLLRHPEDTTLWAVYGRVDEQIILSNGEKTNPVPLEAMLARDPHIAAAVMFGQGRLLNGVLIEPAATLAFDPEDPEGLAEFRNLIWPAVERVNKYAPAHSKLFKEMILVSKPSKPLEYTMKGQPRRPMAIKSYEPEIDALYEAVKETSQLHLAPPSSWTREGTRVFLRSVVGSVLDASRVGDEDDLFLVGCDSLKATYVRNSVVHALRQTTTVSTQTLPSNFVYKHPSISSLTDFVVTMLAKSHDPEATVHDAKVQLAKALVEKYGVNFPRHTPRSDCEEGTAEVVLLTGTTGRLGSHLLAQLLSRSSVATVFALNRASKTSLASRQKEAFKSWSLDDGLINSPKLILVEANFAAPKLGLDEELYTRIQYSVTGIIHNAWRVDFNLSLSSFEELIAGLRNLIDLALSSPHREPPPFLFTSSVGVITVPEDRIYIAEEPIRDPEDTVGRGYGASKWVAESILLRAHESTSLRTNIVRVGQLAGDSAVGGWNEKEWVPAMLRSSQELGCFPMRDQMIYWIAVDVAAASLLDMLGSNEPVLHLVHPRPIHWSTVSEVVAEYLDLQVVPYDKWVAALKNAGEHSTLGTLEKSPALKLADFFLNSMPKAATWSTDKAVTVSLELRVARQLGKEDVKRWIEYWKHTGFISV
ncbi:acetyl-CoA synthetase-like protein [Auriscalpium vulgare]|uniref:Acetyl-CoA synthetase-like protein n=1 Tax=Auriscalpium vulgare TaxID=40419 RepID=A0ACB8S2X1_9AGAM|nr:acetyl-CoA synthetase-like protein [Auriscalpium vulgare]